MKIKYANILGCRYTVLNVFDVRDSGKKYWMCHVVVIYCDAHRMSVGKNQETINKVISRGHTDTVIHAL